MIHHLKRRLDRVGRFSRIHGRYQRTDRTKMELGGTVYINGPLTLSYVRRGLKTR